MATWFTSDTHFFHRNITGPTVSDWVSGFRTFKSISEMNETLISNWNNKVAQEDEVYHLGDFSFGSAEQALSVKKRLNGTIYLIKGNHDKPALAIRDEFAWVKDVAMVSVGKQSLWLSHFAHRVWDQSHRGVYHLYGHSHGSLPDDPNSFSFDCGIDCHGYAPISFEDVVRIMNKKSFKPKDHHG